MKKSISVVVAMAALLAVGSAFTGRYQVLQWNVDHPAAGQPGIYLLTETQVKTIYCPGVDNVECAYLISNPVTIVKKP